MILDVVYGIEIEDKYDPFVITAEIVNHALAVAGNTGTFLVDNFPARECITLHHTPRFKFGVGLNLGCCSQIHPVVVAGRIVQAEGGGVEEGDADDRAGTVPHCEAVTGMCRLVGWLCCPVSDVRKGQWHRAAVYGIDAAR